MERIRNALCGKRDRKEHEFIEQQFAGKELCDEMQMGLKEQCEAESGEGIILCYNDIRPDARKRKENAKSDKDFNTIGGKRGKKILTFCSKVAKIYKGESIK